MDLNQARKNLEYCLGENLRKEYFIILRKCAMLKSPITVIDFNKEVRKLLTTEEQIRCHTYFTLALMSKPDSKPKIYQNDSEKSVFESGNYQDYLQSSRIISQPLIYEHRSAVAELFLPDSPFIAMRTKLTAWENGLDGTESNVTELLVNACQVFVKNILTAMISRIKSYKIKNKKLQYGFNLPLPDPLIRNYDNIIDDLQEIRVDVAEKGNCFQARTKISLENAEQQMAFSYSCAKEPKSNNSLTLRLLYDTLKDNPHLLGSHEMQTVSLLKLGLLLDE